MGFFMDFLQSPLQSKKFIFAMITNLLWLVILAYSIRQSMSDSVLMAIIYTAGATQSLYLGGQSAIDAWVRGGKTISSTAQTAVQEKQVQKESEEYSGKIKLPSRD